MFAVPNNNNISLCSRRTVALLLPLLSLSLSGCASLVSPFLSRPELAVSPKRCVECKPLPTARQ